ncbi:di-heme oxidoredictase family protein [Vibrio genomosp. F10]|uniref:Thiol oxidoreductase n=2 Tax=Vibrio genomosp. F10 TaxID=723171 RepID=A0A1B9QVW1_9VIBR|nr:di-heme oxidoredictase family protein [Vibrio genomosp. F10]OCH73377.1 thiol oxidoreductase [Vibrio genomosp. F10]OEE38074.1 thiol oxidoreductase [Vibrio genomosp. F10 str. ZF-129]OEE94942.1 thiol oxidoreductase [Vibrio genomosp. F10 str. 9ZC157]
MTKIVFSIIGLLSTCVMANDIDQQQHLSAGATSVKSVHASAFSQPSANLTDGRNILKFHGGNKFFEEPWAQAVGSVSSQDGLGPLFNNNACQDCHIRDGRGHASKAEKGMRGTDFNSMLLRASKSDITQEQQDAINQSLMANVPDTCIGGQLQHQSNFGIAKEATQAVSYQYYHVEFSDGESVELRRPTWHVKAQGCDINNDTVLSARVAPQMIGLGLLALIDEAQILAQQDIEDKDNNGISGRANFVWSVDEDAVALGRFGWKAGQPTIRQQTAGAFLGDMGLTTELFTTENCMPHQKDCLAAPSGNGDMTGEYSHEVSSKVLEKVVFYSSHLSVPERRNAYDEKVLAGKALFNDIGCHQCHTESYTTQQSKEFPELSGQKIYPYTDMLLHDMGLELTDFDKHSKFVQGNIQVEFLAQANEWRTAPLWGLGLAQTVDPNATFLHDGRARTIMEAILWHGGEASTQQQAVLQLDKAQRESLMVFLNDL